MFGIDLPIDLPGLPVGGNDGEKSDGGGLPGADLLGGGIPGMDLLSGGIPGMDLLGGGIPGMDLLSGGDSGDGGESKGFDVSSMLNIAGEVGLF